MAGFCCCNVGAIRRRDWIPFWEPVAGDQEFSWLQPAPDRQPRRRKGPRRQCRVPRRQPLRDPASLGGAAHWSTPEYYRIWVGLARRHGESARFAFVGGESKWMCLTS